VCDSGNDFIRSFLAVVEAKVPDGQWLWMGASGVSDKSISSYENPK